MPIPKMHSLPIIALLLVLLFNPQLQAETAHDSTISWQGWTDDLFDKAKTQKRFVLLDLEAVWCHWCHVMEETTYQDPKVVELIQSNYIPVRVDQDSRPDLSNRYEDYGWPATVVFSPQGSEIVKFRGYIAPDRMASILREIILDPTPGPSIFEEEEPELSAQAFLTSDQQKIILQEHLDLYDSDFGGWGKVYKLIDPDQLEYALVQADYGDKKEKAMAQKTLDAALNLLDPVWGGFYQYSDKRDWKSPHFEKIMSIQASSMRLYALAYAYWKKSEYLEAAKKTAQYLADFLTSPGGVFYTSPDADLNSEITGHDYYARNNDERRKLGIPRIDTHIYSRENGWVISALMSLYDATGEKSYLDQALRAVQWIISNRNLPGGGFRHDEKDPAGPYLGDNLAMGKAFLDLYTSTGDRLWLQRAQETAAFIEKNFKDSQKGGFATVVSGEDTKSPFKKSVRQKDENIGMVRFSLRLYHYTGNESNNALAEHAMRYLASPTFVKNKRFLAGLLLADRELATEPIHMTVVGKKEDPKAIELYRAALRYPATYRRIEWWDKREGPLPNPDVKYPELTVAAAFACAQKTCSLPVFEPAKVAQAVDRLKRKKVA